MVFRFKACREAFLKSATLKSRDSLDKIWCEFILADGGRVMLEIFLIFLSLSLSLLTPECLFWA